MAVFIDRLKEGKNKKIEQSKLSQRRSIDNSGGSDGPSSKSFIIQMYSASKTALM